MWLYQCLPAVATLDARANFDFSATWRFVSWSIRVAPRLIGVGFEFTWPATSVV
jgi:hypothetical protein